MRRKHHHHRMDEFRESEDYYDMAMMWLDQNNNGKARECLQHAIEMNPNFIYAYVTLAELYEKQKSYSEAIRTLKDAFRVDNKFDRLPYLIARNALEEGDLRTAKKYIAVSIEMNPCTEYEELHDRIENAWKYKER